MLPSPGAPSSFSASLLTPEGCPFSLFQLETLTTQCRQEPAPSCFSALDMEKEDRWRNEILGLGQQSPWGHKLHQTLGELCQCPCLFHSPRGALTAQDPGRKQRTELASRLRGTSCLLHLHSLRVTTSSLMALTTNYMLSSPQSIFPDPPSPFPFHIATWPSSRHLKTEVLIFNPNLVLPHYPTSQ